VNFDHGVGFFAPIRTMRLALGPKDQEIYMAIFWYANSNPYDLYFKG